MIHTGSDDKESVCSAGATRDTGLIPGLGRYLGEGNGNPLQSSCLENLCGQRNLAGCSKWGCKELDTTEWLSAHTVKDFHEVNEGEIDVFLELPCFFYEPMDVGNLISGSSAFSKSSLYIWKFLVHMLFKPSLKDFFEHDLVSMWNERNCAVVWTFFGIVLLWDYNENWFFPVLWSLLSAPNLLAHWVQHFNSLIF